MSDLMDKNGVIAELKGYQYKLCFSMNFAFRGIFLGIYQENMYLSLNIKTKI